VDQYIWGIIQSLSNAPYDEVTIDTAANWKPVLPIGVTNDQDLGLSVSSISTHSESSLVITIEEEEEETLG